MIFQIKVNAQGVLYTINDEDSDYPADYIRES